MPNSVLARNHLVNFSGTEGVVARVASDKIQQSIPLCQVMQHTSRVCNDEDRSSAGMPWYAWSWRTKSRRRYWMEREYKHRPAGLRTLFICHGAAMYTAFDALALEHIGVHPDRCPDLFR